MEIMFDAAAAEKLIQQMDRYCSGVQKETRALLDVLKNPGDWQDNQMRAFQTNMNELAKDLQQALVLEGDYLRTFDERVKELRG